MNRESITPLNARSESIIFTDLQSLCCSSGYAHAIAYFCWRDNLIGVSGDQITEKDIQDQHSQKQLIRTEISTLIGLLAKGDINIDVPEPIMLQSYIDRTEALLHEMHMSLQKPWMAAFQEMARNPKKARQESPFDTAAGLREPIFYGGESAYSFQYEALARMKYQADNAWLKLHRGFTIDEACEVVRAIYALQSRKILGFREMMISLPFEQWTFFPCFSFNLDELKNFTEIDLHTTALVVAAFSVNRENKNRPFSSLSEFSETNAAPIIEYASGSYVLFQHYSLLEALYEAPFFWMSADKAYYAAASKNRGAFSEQFIFDRLTSVFGSLNVFHNIDIYKGKDRVAEADVLVLYGKTAIVIQAKSKRLTIEARKGNDLQLKDDFKKAIHAAYDQAILCAQAILGIEHKYLLPSGDEIHISKNINEVFPICAVSDHYPALSAQVRQFLKTAHHKNIYNPIATDIFFIDVLTEILRSPLHFLNYIHLRIKFDKQLLISNELTTLGYHLKHNLWLEKKYDMVNLGEDFTSSLDLAMSVRRLGIPGEGTPKGILTRFEGTPIGLLLAKIEASAHPELVGLGMLFLQLSSETAKHINNGIRRIMKEAAEDGNHHDFSVPSETGGGFTIHVNTLPDDIARERLGNHCKFRKYDTKSDSWYGVLLSDSAEIRAVLSIEENWKTDDLPLRISSRMD